MSRAALRPVLAWLLLLCLLRTLLPEAWLVAWHRHQHTTYEPASTTRQHCQGSKLWFTARHQHCHAEQFYNVPFAAAVCPAVPVPPMHPCYVRHGSTGPLLPLPGIARAAASRGPPAA